MRGGAVPENVPEPLRGKRVPWAMCLGFTPGDARTAPPMLRLDALDEMAVTEPKVASNFLAGAVVMWTMLADADQRPILGCVCPVCLFLGAGYVIFGEMP